MYKASRIQINAQDKLVGYDLLRSAGRQFRLFGTEK